VVGLATSHTLEIALDCSPVKTIQCTSKSVILVLTLSPSYHRVLVSYVDTFAKHNVQKFQAIQRDGDAIITVMVVAEYEYWRCFIDCSICPITAE